MAVYQIKVERFGNPTKFTVTVTLRNGRVVRGCEPSLEKALKYATRQAQQPVAENLSFGDAGWRLAGYISQGQLGIDDESLRYTTQVENRERSKRAAEIKRLMKSGLTKKQAIETVMRRKPEA